jgi:hypothetical protein
MMVTSFYYRYIPRQVIGALCALILCGTLVAGLWPFHSPKNRVQWLGNRKGIRIDRYGTVVSSGHFEPASSDGPSCSLEVWLKPRLTWDKGTFLAFYNPLNSQQFSLQQYYTYLLLQRVGKNGYRQTDLSVDQVFRRKQALITITSDGHDTAVYIDGNLVTRSSRFGLSLMDHVGCNQNAHQHFGTLGRASLPQVLRTVLRSRPSRRAISLMLTPS